MGNRPDEGRHQALDQIEQLSRSLMAEVAHEMRGRSTEEIR